MKTLLSGGASFITILLTAFPTGLAAPADTTPPAVPNAIGLFQFRDINTSTKQHRNSHACDVQFHSVLGSIWGNIQIGTTFCSDMNGKVQATGEGGTLVVDFNANVPGDTSITFQLDNGTYTGCTAASKVSGSMCYNTALSFAAPGTIHA